MPHAPTNTSVKLEWLAGCYAVCRLDPRQPLPEWCSATPFESDDPKRTLFCITRTDGELSIVINESLLPAALDESIKVQRGFIGLRIKGSLDFAVVGLLAKLTDALASAKVPVFVISTYETDFLLIPAERLDDSTVALGKIANLAAHPL